MMRRFSRVSVAAVLLALGVAIATPADKLPRTEIAKRGKSATALVEIKPTRAAGTAFCVHPSGLFVTNEHVVRGAENAEISLVLNPSLESQRVLRAKIARSDKDLDLALLRVESAGELVSLPLGPAEEVTELMEIVAFGFPFGRSLAPNLKEYPAVSVNAGSVTALRRKAGALDRIQLDAGLNPGNSGGPVLDEQGRVIGVVVSGLAGGARINQAIPVSHLARFLDAPVIQFAPPELTREALRQPMEFTARVVSLLPGAREPGVRLVLRAGEEPDREFSMHKRDGMFVTSAAPFAKDDRRRSEIIVRFDSGSVSGMADDVVFKVGDKPVRLSGTQQIDLKPKPRVVLSDGKTIMEGEITNLGPIQVAIGEQSFQVDLAKAVQMRVLAEVEPVLVTATIVASLDGKEIGRLQTTIPIRDNTRLTPADPSTVVIAPPAMAEDRVVKKLPDAFTDVVLGGGGRYLIFHLPRLRKLAIFDVNEARVTNYIPVDDDKPAFAAGLDKLVVGLPSKDALERWSLTTFEREMNVRPSFKEGIKGVLMGHASNGPVVVNGFFLDLGNFRPLPITYPHGQATAWGSAGRLYPSGDGTVFASWNSSYSPGTSATFVLEGSEIKRNDDGELGHVIPGPDGTLVYTAKGVVSARLKRSDPEDATLGWCLPAVRGPYFVSLTPGEGGKGGGLTVHLLGQKRPLARLDKMGHGLSFDGWAREEFGAWKRLYFIPQANVIVVLPPSNDQVVLYKLNVDAALEGSGLDYLFVTSQPPRTANRGATFTYQIVAKAKRDGPLYRLDSGPKGMTISKSGLVEWPVPAGAADGDQEVILTIRDSAGQEVFHTFTLRLLK